jgi:hypothetical protein
LEEKQARDSTITANRNPFTLMMAERETVITVSFCLLLSPGILMILSQTKEITG